MSDLYSKQNMNSKEAQAEAHRILQKKQLQILDEDGILRRFQKAFEDKRKMVEQTRRDIEKLEIDLLNLKRKEDLLRKDLTTAERDITFQKAKIKKLEYDAEQYREKTYRRDKME
jgi:hypothetical protein